MLPLMTTRVGVLGRNNAISLSDLAGHASFMMLALSYMEADVLNLRMYALGGLSLSVVFQFFRPEPLWLPIGWNTLFLVINGCMVLLMLKEARDAEQLPAEEMAVYELTFRKLGLTHVEYLHLMSFAEKREAREGELLMKQGEVQDRLHIIAEGGATVLANGHCIARMTPGQFVGEMTFLSFMEQSELGTPVDESQLRATADVRVEAKCVTFTWAFDELQALLRSEPNLAHAFQGSISLDLRDKMANTRLPRPTTTRPRPSQKTPGGDDVQESER